MAGRLQEKGADVRKRRLVISKSSQEERADADVVKEEHAAKDGHGASAVDSEGAEVKSRKRLKLVKTTGPLQVSNAAEPGTSAVKREPQEDDREGTPAVKREGTPAVKREGTSAVKREPQEESSTGGELPAAALPMTTEGRCAPDPRRNLDIEEERNTDFTGLLMHHDHSSRPIFACPDGRIIFETWHSKSAQVADFLIAVAEPVSRPELVHEYQITMLSLNAAVSTGIEVETIIKLLRKLSKNELASEFVSFIKEQGRVIGRLKLVLRNQRHFLEADDPGLLVKLLANSEITNSLVDRQLTADTIHRTAMIPRLQFPCPSPDSTCSNEQDFQEDHTAGLTTASAEINSLRVEIVKNAAHQMNMSLLQEYEYKQDRTDANPELPILLRNSANLRPYQQRALSKMFAVDGVAKSGIVVLPCGAGKTLTGIAACCRIQRRTLVLTTTAVAVDQWKRQLIEYSTIPPEDIYVFTAEHKRPIEDHERRACVLISTYSMLGFGGKRTGDSELILSQIEQLDWGLMIVDEVQVMPARTFRTVATTVKAHCCLGLTATLVREDDLIYDLHWLIGPKLYEANWQQLQDEGYLARVRCVEVWCEMSKPFFAEYLRAVDDKDGHKRRALWNCNPNKLKVCEYLIKVHESRGDKTIVFSDNIFILEKLAKQLGRYYICGKVDMRERMQILAAFKESPNCNTIFLSQVGDNAIDIPAASVIIQISSHYGSRRQEAQRLGRILRPKPKSHGSTSKFNAFFYSLVSRDTQEMYYANRRQQFLVEQGYNYYILRNLADKRMDNDAPTYTSEDAQLQLLKEVLETMRRGDMGEFEDEDVALHDSNAAAIPKAGSAVKSEAASQAPRTPTATGSSRQTVSEKRISLASLSGGLDGSYAVTTAFKQKALKQDSAV